MKKLLNDPELITNVLGGDQQAFRLLVEKHQAGVFKTAMGFVHNKEDAEEITQDSFVKAYRALASFNHTSAFSTWLYRIVVNTSLNFLKRRNRKKILTHLFPPFGALQPQKYAVEWLEEKEEMLLVQNAIDRLPHRQRVAFILSKYDELPEKEIATLMGVSPGSVEQLIVRAKANLKKELLQRRKI